MRYKTKETTKKIAVNHKLVVDRIILLSISNRIDTIHINTTVKKEACFAISLF
jgi:hypothetical protein